jgi:hypothetical protein
VPPKSYRRGLVALPRLTGDLHAPLVTWAGLVRLDGHPEERLVVFAPSSGQNATVQRAVSTAGILVNRRVDWWNIVPADGAARHIVTTAGAYRLHRSRIFAGGADVHSTRVTFEFDPSGHLLTVESAQGDTSGHIGF